MRRMWPGSLSASRVLKQAARSELRGDWASRGVDPAILDASKVEMLELE